MRLRAALRESWDLVGADLPILTLAAFLTITLSLLSAFILTLPLLVGMCIMFLEKMHGRQPQLQHLWEGLTDHFPASIVLWIVMMLATAPLDLLYPLLHRLEPPWTFLLLPLWLLGLCLVLTPFSFALPLIADRDLSTRQAVKLSWAQVRPRLLSIFVLNIVLVGVVLLGGLACCVGIVITLPLALATLVLTYRGLYEDFAVPQMTPIREDLTSEVDDDEDN